MRLFIGVPLPRAAEAEVAGLLRRLQAHHWPVRWVPDHGLHLTLKFFGDVTSDRLEAIVELLAFSATGMAPIGLSLGRSGVFPTWARPRVIHLEVRAGPDLELLQDRIERGGANLGFPPEGRPFRPHLTLGRIREGERLPDGWKAALEAVPPGEPFLADRVTLFESQLAGPGRVYSVRHQVRLA
jgi:2'-5' RNA ligase